MTRKEITGGEDKGDLTMPPKKKKTVVERLPDKSRVPKSSSDPEPRGRENGPF